jgi:hypothetical protein
VRAASSPIHTGTGYLVLSIDVRRLVKLFDGNGGRSIPRKAFVRAPHGLHLQTIWRNMHAPLLSTIPASVPLSSSAVFLVASPHAGLNGERMSCAPLR